MKVLFVSYCNEGGGAAKAINNIYQSFRNNIRFKFIVIEKRGRNKNIWHFRSGLVGKVLRKIRYYIAVLILLGHTKIIMSLNIVKSGLGKFINKSNFDLINLHWIGCETISLIEIEKINKPIIWTFHDMWPISGIYHTSLDKKYFNHDCNNFIKKKYFQFLDTFIKKKKNNIFYKKKINIITPSRWLLDECKKKIYIGGHSEVIPNPIKIEIYKSRKNINDIKKKYNIPLNKKILLYSSIFLNDKKKGFSLLNGITNDPSYEKFQFIFLGNLIDSEENSFSSNIKFINANFLEHVIIDLYSISDVLLYPSLIDNLPNTILEAMSCGLPCVAFNCYGMKEIITHKKDGYLAKPYSVEDFKKGIAYILNNRLSVNARKKVINNYSPHIIKKKYLNFFKKVLNSNYL
jgi:glycosyltransferase involved in cell wall biosynthesis